jgi:hypothetical protein
LFSDCSFCLKNKNFNFLFTSIPKRQRPSWNEETTTTPMDDPVEEAKKIMVKTTRTTLK